MECCTVPFWATRTTRVVVPLKGAKVMVLKLVNIQKGASSMVGRGSVPPHSLQLDVPRLTC